MSSTMAALDLFKIKILWNKGYDVIISLYDVSNTILSHDLNHIVNVVMWPKFGNSSISMRVLIKKVSFLEALGIALEFYTSVAKELKLKVRKLWGLISTFIEVTENRRPFAPPIQ